MSDDNSVGVAGDYAHSVRVALVLLHGAQFRQKVDIIRAESHSRCLEREACTRTRLHEQRTHYFAL